MNNMIIGQSGGPTRVINQSLVGAIQEAKKHEEIGEIYGMKHGITGVFNEEFINLREIDDKQLEIIAGTPGSALGSCRHKPTPEDCERVFEVFEKYGIKYYFYIGGNDTAETAHIVSKIAAEKGYDFKAFHIPKTIDNDLRVTDHCPGYPSAARYVAECFLGNEMDNRSLKGVKIDIVMGRNAGWLTAAAALAKFQEDAGPHLIYLPETPKPLPEIVQEIDATVDKYGRCVVAVSEGIKDETGELLAKKFSKETDSHGNIQLSGTGALGDMLADHIKNNSKHDGLRVRTDTLGYAQRSYADTVSEVDSREAHEVGAAAVKFALTDAKSGSVYIKRVSNAPYNSEIKLTELKNVAKVTKDMPRDFINEAGNGVTEKFLEYARPLVGDITKVSALF
jgi:ATP-dependent phosphofructokinase / diphosphate-dependent phosphofructokinase